MPATVNRYDGAGVTLTSSGTTWDTAVRVKSLGGFKRTIAALDDTPLSATDDEELVFATLRKNEPMEIEFFSDGDEPATIDGVPLTWVITFMPKIGQTNGATITFTGALTMEDTGPVAQGQRRISKATLTPDGKTGPTFADGS